MSSRTPTLIGVPVGGAAAGFGAAAATGAVGAAAAAGEAAGEPAAAGDPDGDAAGDAAVAAPGDAAGDAAGAAGAAGFAASVGLAAAGALVAAGGGAAGAQPAMNQSSSTINRVPDCIRTLRDDLVTWPMILPPQRCQSSSTRTFLAAVVSASPTRRSLSIAMGMMSGR